MTAKTDSVDNQSIERAHDEDEKAELGKDEIYHLLQNERRRNVLRYLRDRDGTIQMRDIAEQVAAWEHDTTVQALMSDQRQRVYIALYQAHLPKLDEEGIIDYNQSRGFVEKKPLADELIRHLERPHSDEGDADEGRPWEMYYLGVSALSAALIGASGFGLPLIGSIPPLSIALAILGIYTALTSSLVLSNSKRSE
jgi:hypothetical protein